MPWPKLLGGRGAKQPAVVPMCDGAELTALMLGKRAAIDEQLRADAEKWTRAIHEFNEWSETHIPKLLRDSAEGGLSTAVIMVLPNQGPANGDLLTGVARRIWELCERHHVGIVLESDLKITVGYQRKLIPGAELVAHWGQKPYDFSKAHTSLLHSLMGEFKRWPVEYYNSYSSPNIYGSKD